MVATASICPVCGAPRAAQASICDSCGLVFGSRPAATPPAHTAAYGFTRLQPGQLLAHGRYSVQRVLSKGGMGAIYLATDHETFGRAVVVKAMLDYFDPADTRAASAARARFVHEAQTLAALRHPAIPPILAYFQEGPHNYIVMEYIEGHDLLQRLTHRGARGKAIAGRPYPRADVLRWGATLCQVLEYLSSHRPHPVVHHDIKPANLLLDSSSGDIRLVDFGTARARLLAQGAGIGLRQSSLYGTQGYAAPEQYGGQSEPRSDVYALAATLYHLATDDDPCDHPFDFPRLHQLGAFGQALSQALVTAVDKRLGAAELRQRLEDLRAPTPAAPPTRVRRPIGAPDGIDIYSVVELARWCEAHWHMGADWLYGALPDQVEQVWGRADLAQQLRDTALRRHDDRSAGLDAALALLDPAGFGAARGQVITAAQALDFGALAPRAACEQQLLLANSGRRHVSAVLALPGWISAAQDTISLAPGQQLAIDLSAASWRAPAGRQLHDSLAVRAGTTTLLEVETWAEMPRWSTAQRRRPPWVLPLLAVLSLVLLLIWALAPAPAPVTYRPSPAALSQATSPAQPIATSAPATLPDAQVAAAQPSTNMIAATPAQPQSGLFQAVKTLSAPGGQLQSAAFSPDGDTLAIGDARGGLRLWSVDDSALRWSADGRAPVRALAFSPDGRLLATSGISGTVELRQAGDGQLLATLDGHAGPVEELAFSPDSRLLAAAGGKVLALRRAEDGDELWGIEGPDAYVHDLAFSPDGQQLVAAGEQGAITLWSVTDGEPARALGLRRGALACVAFSPDGQTLAVGSAGGAVELLRIADGTAFRSIDIQGGPVWSVAFSPDGAYLAAASDDAHVRILRAGDGALLQTLDTQGRSMRSLRFSPDGKTLAAIGDQGTAMFWRATQ